MKYLVFFFFFNLFVSNGPMKCVRHDSWNQKTFTHLSPHSDCCAAALSWARLHPQIGLLSGSLSPHPGARQHPIDSPGQPGSGLSRTPDLLCDFLVTRE